MDPLTLTDAKSINWALQALRIVFCFMFCGAAGAHFSIIRADFILCLFCIVVKMFHIKPLPCLSSFCFGWRAIAFVKVSLVIVDVCGTVYMCPMVV